MIDQSIYTDRHEVYLSTSVYSCPEILVPDMMLFQPVGNVCNQMGELWNLLFPIKLFLYSHLKTEGIFTRTNI